MVSRRPPKIAELTVYALAPFDKKGHVVELRKRFRECLRKNGEWEARKFAYWQALSRRSRNQRGCAIVVAGAADWRGDDAGGAC